MNHDKQRRGPPIQLLAPLRRQLDQVLRAAHRLDLGFRKIVSYFLSLNPFGNPPATVLMTLLGSR